MRPVPVTLNDHTRGDTWEGITIGPVMFNGAQPTSVLSSCRMQFRDDNDTLGYELNSVPATGKGPITITNSTTWVVTVPAQQLPLDAATWRWDFETTDAGGVVRTLYSGILRIKADVTHV